MCSEKNLSQCHFAHHKSHVDCPGIESIFPRWGNGDEPPEPREGKRPLVRSDLIFSLFIVRRANYWYYITSNDRIYSFIHSVVCLTSPFHLPKRVLHRVRSSAFSFNFQYPLFPKGHSVAAYDLPLVFLSFLCFPLSFLQQRVIEGSSYARCDQST